ncbi:MAG: NADP-dependent isocitrate dehydrogenase [Clostridiales bacterium]|jgi:isocitrate dehydrogenase|nr:NADP-dependent isocitrate dehydrogenase [Clostridiales bacterium]
MKKIRMTNPIVELDGDEMTRVLWQWIKEDLIAPFVDLKSEYYDLGLPNRDKTDDGVTLAAADAIRKWGVGCKCATITPNLQRVAEYGLKRMYPSPNATLRAALDGTIFRAPVALKNIAPYIPGWKKPITIARHAYADVYKAAELRVTGAAAASLRVEYADGKTADKPVHTFDGPGVLMGMFNTDKSIYSFARACFAYALDEGRDLWFATKDTIAKTYDGRFKEIFAEVAAEFAARFEGKGIRYEYMLIDDSVARAVKSEGGFVWALKNYDGDVLSDMAASVMGSLALMTSVLVAPGGQYEYEAAHGTVTRHYYKHLKGEETGTNGVATIFAWSGALRKRGQLDGLPDLAGFADKLERAVEGAINEGVLTGDLAPLYIGTEPVKRVNAREFIREIAGRLG